MNRILIQPLLLLVLLVATSGVLAGNQDLAQGIVIKEVTVVGSTVFDEGDLQAAINPPIGETIYIEDVLEMVDAITSLYVDAGYITSGAVLPDQDVSGGRIVLNVVEGQLAGVNVVSTGRLKTSFLESKIRANTVGPLNLKDLQRAISKLEQEPTVSHVRGDLKPTAERGSAQLDLEVVEADAFKVLIGGDNYKSPSVGEAQAEIAVSHLNLLGLNDRLDLSAQQTDGVDAYAFQYDFPLQAIRSRVSVYHTQGDTLVVEEPFDEIALESETDTSGLQIKTLWTSSAQSAWHTYLNVESKESETSLLGIPFDFSPGSRDGITEAQVIGFNVEYSRSGEGMGLMVRAGLRSGSDEYGGSPSLVDGDFTLYRLQAQWIKRLNSDTSEIPWLLKFNVNYQDTADTLPAFERMALGGHSTVRGYRENRLLKDSGVTASLSLSLPLLTAPRREGISIRGELFFDYGRGENSVETLAVNTRGELSSAGVGIEASYRGLRFKIERALRLQKRKRLGDALQDSGIHVGVSYEL